MARKRGESVAPIRVLIVDDEPAARTVIRRLLKPDPDVVVVGEARHGREAVRALQEDGIDLVFLDIQIPGLDGFGVVREVGAQHMPPTIFVTAFDQHALRAFEVDALDYLLKPFTDERFHEATERAKAAIRQGRLADLSHRLAALLNASAGPVVASTSGYVKRLAVKGDGRVMLVPVRDLDWVQAERDYVRLHVGKQAHVIRETMKKVVGQLDPGLFVRIHRSTIVNIERVRELQPMFKGAYVVVLQDGTELNLSRGYRDHLEAVLGHRL
jgi:two-component system LytT family response regulator